MQMALSQILNCLLILACVWLGGGSAIGQGVITIGFDDLPAPDWTNPLPGNYMGLQWGNFYFYDLAHAENPGYTAGIVSSSNAVFNGYGYPATLSSGVKFDLISACLTAAFENGVLFEARGFAGTNQLYDLSYGLQNTGPAFIEFNFLGVDSVEFLSYGQYAANEFVMDNLVVRLPPKLTLIASPPSSVVLSWPTNAPNMVLQSTTTLGSTAVWTPVSAKPVTVNGQYTVTNPISGGQQFFRLSQ
ncbi:MAG: hypothetical protein JWQ71_4157 [Pedosphaera sp.]|nr:hypothetical protein [Pedosphaera sp.]